MYSGSNARYCKPLRVFSAFYLTTTPRVAAEREREMAEFEGASGRTNGPAGSETAAGGGEETLYGVLRGFVAGVVSPEDLPPAPVIKRVRSSFCKSAPLLRDASRNSARDLLLWTRSGGPIRSLFVVSVGTIVLLALTGLLVFMVFFLAATLNAIIISFLISLAAAGGFLALFFVCLTTIYIGALSVAIFIISTATISAIIAVIIATGWIGFFWVIWLAAKKSMDLTKQSLSMTSSAISAYSATRHAR